MSIFDCFRYIDELPPPLNTTCNPDVCGWNQPDLDGRCRGFNHRPEEPWFVFVDGQWCSCCCGYGVSEPIEVYPDVFAMISDVVPGDMVLAAGADLAWRPARVSAGATTDGAGYAMLNVVYRYGEGDVRAILATEDTLFFTPDGQFRSAAILAPGDRLRRADGGEAEIIGPVTETAARGSNIVELAAFDGQNLDGHLINMNGVVVADFSVQRAFTGGSTGGALFDAANFDGSRPRAGTEEYSTRFAPTAEFLAAAAASGVRIGASAARANGPIINVPPEARSLLFEGQAGDVETAAPRFPDNAMHRVTLMQRIFDRAQRRDDEVMLIDWDNKVPNAHAFTHVHQRFIVLTGGLLRVRGLTDAGLSLLVAQLQAHLDQPGSCVGEMIEAAVNGPMRQMWAPVEFPVKCQKGVEEIRRLFGFVEADNAQEAEDDRCARPSLECQMLAFEAAMAAQPIPECAGGPGVEH